MGQTGFMSRYLVDAWLQLFEIDLIQNDYFRNKTNFIYSELRWLHPLIMPRKQLDVSYNIEDQLN